MYLNLSTEIKRKGITHKEFAHLVEIDEGEFSKKINALCDFNYDEVIRILKFFKHTLSADYLFKNTVKNN